MQNAEKSPLQAEIAYFNEHRADLIAHHLGKFVVVKGNRLAGTFDSGEAAYDAGVAEFGTQPFMVRQVELVESVVNIPGLYAGVLAMER